MAGAYAAVVSLTHTIEQTMEHHARHPVFMDKQQRQIESLQQKVSFLQHFLEVYSNGGSDEAEGLSLTSPIADVAYAAQDIIESHVTDSVLSRDPKRRHRKNMNDKVNFKSHGKNSSNHFSQLLQNVIEKIDCVKKEVMEVKGKIRVKDQQPHDRVPVVSSRPYPTGKDTVMEYYNDDLEQIMDKLTGQSSNLQIIPIVGMGGIGKTTLARNIFDYPLIVECFYPRAWVTVSQEYDLREMLLRLLHEMGVSSREEESSEFHQLGEKLHKHLSGRRYLIIMDDIWSIEACEKLKVFLPDNNNGSRVMVTTRLSNVADCLSSSDLYNMKFLDRTQSWNLLCRKVFGHVKCPPELEEIGKDIAENCNGLPLSIEVIGGLLAKSEMTRKYWEYVAKYISQIVNSEEDGHWLKTLSLSYSHLPIHLKPCFLYMGGFREDSNIRVSELIKLWVAEGFLKPDNTKSLEEVAKNYLKDLIERNLIFVRKRGSTGKMKRCGIHDLLRDLCLKEAEKERFLSIVKVHNRAQSVNKECRIVFHEDMSHDQRGSHEFRQVLQSTPFMRSLACFSYESSSSWQLVHNHRLMRVLNVSRFGCIESNIFKLLVNLRILNCDERFPLMDRLDVSQVFRLCYLQSLILPGYEVVGVAPNEIWEMSQLRHIKMRNLCLPDPVHGQINRHGHEDFVLKHLQTLTYVKNFECTEGVLKRIPNIKKLGINNSKSSNYGCLHNLSRLHKLQSLRCILSRDMDFFPNLVFPKSLEKLTLWHCRFDWDDFTEKVGSLPHLEKLRLHRCSTGSEWNTVDGKFLGLKYLSIEQCNNLECWTAESSHFPRLQRLDLYHMIELKEIPSGIGETLQSIVLLNCKISVEASAREILEEQLSMGNEGLQLKIWNGGTWVTSAAKMGRTNEV